MAFSFPGTFTGSVQPLETEFFQEAFSVNDFACRAITSKFSTVGMRVIAHDQSQLSVHLRKRFQCHFDTTVI